MAAHTCRHNLGQAAALRERLLIRGWETKAKIETRVGRANGEICAIEGPVHFLDNSGRVHDAIEQFLVLLLRLSESVPAQNLEDPAVIRLAQERQPADLDWPGHERRKVRL